MGALGFVFAALGVGYILGVWTGGLVFRKHQGPYVNAVADKRYPLWDDLGDHNRSEPKARS